MDYCSASHSGLCSHLASCRWNAGPEDEPAAAYDDDDGDFVGDDHPGFEDEGVAGSAAEQTSDRRQSLGMLGLNGSQVNIRSGISPPWSLRDSLEAVQARSAALMP